MQPTKPTFNVLKAILLLIAVVMIATAASGYYFYQNVVIDNNRVRLEQLSEEEAERRSNNVAAYVTAQRKKIELYSSREWIAQLLLEETPMARTRFNETLKEGYSEALDVALYNLNRKNIVRAGTPPPSFVIQDMLNRSESKSRLVPEAARVEKAWQVYFASPVYDSLDPESRKVIGTLVVTMPAQALFKVVAGDDESLGQTTLLRLAPRAPIRIYQSGQTTLKMTATHAIDGSDWVLNFQPSEKFADDARQLPLLLILIHLIAAATLVASGTFLILKHAQRLQRASASDLHAQEDRIEEVDIAEEDTDILQLEDANEEPEDEGPQELVVETVIELPDEVFRAYDIRGKAGVQISVDFAYLLGQALATEALSLGENALFVARDGRTHSPELCDALIEGIVSTGCHVTDLGAVPTPLLYFATCEIDGSLSGVMVTASHNSADYNGFKMVLKGKSLIAEDVQRIKTRMIDQEFYRGPGEVTELDVVPTYIERIFSDVALAGTVKIVVDAGNGITGEVAPLLLEELGCEVVKLHCEIDGNFPNHDPDPTIISNLQDLISTVKETGADLGVALDGDGDRLVLVTSSGNIIWPDRLLMLLARDIVSGNPGADVIFDVKSTRELNSLVSSYGGRPIMWKTGHSNMKTKMQETGALVGGEMSGHIFIKDRWYGFDDGMYTAARILEIMTLRDQDIDSLFQSFPCPPSTPELKIDVREDQKFDIIASLLKQARFPEANLNDLDGLRVEFPYGWGLVRASNTSPALTLRFEADTEDNLQQIQALFKAELLKVDPSLSIPF